MKIGFYAIQGVAYAITDPMFVMLLIILGISFYKKNRRTVMMQKMIIGEGLNSSLELTISQIVLGILGGAIGSLILSYLGVSFPNNSVIYMLFLLSIILMFVNHKYICFSYSGALLGLITLTMKLVGDFLGIKTSEYIQLNIVSLMTLVGVMHVVEGFLVMIDGSKGAIPVFANKDEKIMGGFALNRYWAVPIAIMLMFSKELVMDVTKEQLITPSWWPLIHGGITETLLKSSILAITPFYAVVGYNSITFTKSKKRKSLISGLLILSYGIILSLVAQLASFGYLAQLVVLIFAPIAHEGMLFLDTYFEIKGEAKYTSSEEGIMVLEVAPNSPAQEMGIESGDLLIEVNNKSIDSEKDIFENLRELQNFLWLKVKKGTGEIKEIYYNSMTKDKRLGVVFVPKSIAGDDKFIKYKGSSKKNFKDILDSMKGKEK
ncbi:PDZ domain-containing protein [Hathewaya massiliensis]|uniref:PDZ domain-containing protein n=1 Tax=Hathewaya massiliensis TaxID=1964382 RepID=UPI00115AF8B7|nr:PDZ domain-containing protein [Hathewaya massiliensis]